MEKEKVLALAGRLRLPEAVLPSLAAGTLPEGLNIEQLAEPEGAEAAWQAISHRLPDWQEDGGMAHLAVMLAAACRTEDRYRREGIPEEVFLATMDCFRRFLEETRARTGRWAFDRGFWTWRQTGGLLFRLGTLEFEYTRMEAGPRPEGLEAGAPVLSVHIPSDAVLKREELDASYRMARQFFSRASLCPFGRPEATVCGSWLLAPALDELLPEDSGIRRFAGDYLRYDTDGEDQDFYEWLFGGYRPTEELPERTGLQRAVKARLAAGGCVGMARGVLKERKQTMELVKLTHENLEREHICCAISNNRDVQVMSKKDWLRERLDEGLVFLKGNVRGKCFIEYIPAEYAWAPVEAEGYMYIDCLWVSGQFKGHGYSNLLLDACIEDGRAKGKKGLVVLSSKKKLGFLADPGYMRHRGFMTADLAEPCFELLYLPFAEGAEQPRFRDTVREHGDMPDGFVLYYTNQCPFTARYVPLLESMAKERNAPLRTVHIQTREAAQNAPSPFTTFSLFCDGQLVTHEILSEKKFDKILSGKGL